MQDNAENIVAAVVTAARNGDMMAAKINALACVHEEELGEQGRGNCRRYREVC
jgi:hypothetical protein